MRQTGKRRARREDGGAKPPAPRTNLYDDVTHRIVAELEAGRFPWVQPWGRTGIAAPGLPRNALTGRSYSGVNILILWGTVIEQGWPPQSWLTFRQRSEEHTSELQSLMRISYAVFCLKKKKHNNN